MDWTRCRKLMWRWSLVTAALIAAFWGIWAIFAPVPVVDSIQIIADYSWQLPFLVSRWWDVLIGPIGSVMIIGVCYVMRHSLVRDSDFDFGLVLRLALGLTFGLVFGLVILVKYITSRNFWVAVGNWLMDKN